MIFFILQFTVNLIKSANIKNFKNFSIKFMKEVFFHFCLQTNQLSDWKIKCYKTDEAYFF